MYPRKPQVAGLDPEGSVLASFYNVDLPGAETLAVYRAPATAASTQQLGSPLQVAQRLAGVAENGQLQASGNERTMLCRTLACLARCFSLFCIHVIYVCSTNI